MSEGGHSRFSASAAHRWMNCPGSLLANEGLPDTPSLAALEGTDAHAVAARVLANGEVAADQYVGLPFEDVADVPSVSGIKTFQKDMAQNLRVYFQAVWDRYCGRPGLSAELYLEEKFPLDDVHPDLGGTGDAVILNLTDRRIDVVDLKYGAGTAVEVEDNPQLKIYALGAFFRFRDAPVDTVGITIVQPRKGHPDGPVRSIDFSVLDLLAWVGELKSAAQACEDPNAPRIAGTWCKFCKIGHLCAEFRTEARKAATDGFGDVVEPENMAADELGKRLREADLLALWVKRIREFAETEARAGRMPAGFKWVAGRGSRKWSQDDDSTLAIVETVTGVDMTERVCPSVAQAEKILGRDIFKTLPDGIVTKSPGKPKLTTEDDPKPAITLEAVHSWKTEGFDDIEE